MEAEKLNMEITQKAVVFRDDGKFLAVRRGKTAPSNALAWDLPGGVLEDDEDPVQGIAREIKEETGLEVSEPIPFDVCGRKHPLGSRIAIAYRCKAISTEVVISWEHDEFKWVTAEEFLKLSTIVKLHQFIRNLDRK